MKFVFADSISEGSFEEVVQVRFDEQGPTRFVEHADGTQTLIIETGPKKNITMRSFARLCRKVIQTAKQQRIERIVLTFEFNKYPQLKKHLEKDVIALMAQSFVMANFEFNRFKTKPEDGWRSVEEIIFDERPTVTSQRALERGQIIGEMINECRALADTPGGDMTPKLLVRETERLISDTKIKLTVLGEKEMKKLKMGAILGVSQGSEEEGQFIILEYKGGRAADKPIVLVGKGVTFDTGGLSLKQADAMVGMNRDMTGGAVAITTTVLAAKLGLKKNVVAIVPAVENSPSGTAYRPGDILTSMSGKTIEVLNTDAEGRLVLADALTYAKQFDPKAVVDIATLTGAALIALGQRSSAFFTDTDRLANAIEKASEETGDPVWRLPLWDEYNNDIKGYFADIANMSTQDGNPRYAGSIIGATFLHQFADDYPWVHIDIAPRMEAIAADNLARGATGEPVALLTKFIESN